jgi:hypothetical protein
MSDEERPSNYKKIIEFIPFKTLSMDLESLLADLARIYMSRNDADMVELIALSEAELFPVGSFDPEAVKYEYVLKLAVPVKFFNHLRNSIGKIQPQLRKDIAAVTAPYIHEVISDVFVVIRIEQDSKWRDAALESIEEEATQGARVADLDIELFHAPADGPGIVADMVKIIAAQGFRVAPRAFTSTKEKDINHALKDFEKNSRFGVCIVSKAFIGLSLSQEAIGLIASFILNPGKRFCQIWDSVSRTDVANLSAGLARSLAYSTERMSLQKICDYITLIAALK